MSKSLCGLQISWGEWLVSEKTRDGIRPSAVPKILRWLESLRGTVVTRPRGIQAINVAKNEPYTCRLVVPSLQYMC